MCIVVVKPKGVALPDEEILTNCWDNNSDGAGFAVARNGQVHVRKGYMSYRALASAMESMGVGVDDSLMLHFRIATAGGVNKRMCHPFPITDSLPDLQKRRVRCNMAVAHNGVIGVGEQRLSDTAVFVRDVLSPRFIRLGLKARDEACISLVKHLGTVGNKFAVMHKDGAVQLMGRFLHDKESGCYFSNTGYSYKRYVGFYDNKWNDLEEYEWYNGYSQRREKKEEENVGDEALREMIVHPTEARDVKYAEQKMLERHLGHEDFTWDPEFYVAHEHETGKTYGFDDGGEVVQVVWDDNMMRFVVKDAHFIIDDRNAPWAHV